jgi:hypothetical protein
MTPNHLISKGLFALVFVVATGAEAALLPVCQRTPAVREFIETALKKTCDTITETDLASIKRVAVGHRNIAKFNAGDFTGLTGLEILNIRSNPYTELPEGLLQDLVRLKTLVIIDTPLRHYPDDFLAANPDIENLHVFRNAVRSISESVFQRLETRTKLKIIDIDATLLQAEKDRLTQLFPANGPVQLNFE